LLPGLGRFLGLGFGFISHSLFQDQEQIPFSDLISDLDLEFLDSTGIRGGKLHRRLVALQGNQRIFRLDLIAGLHQDLDHVDLFEITEVREPDWTFNRHGYQEIIRL
jgi:hypothetical protein